jgi:hypothetical protein
LLAQGLRGRTRAGCQAKERVQTRIVEPCTCTGSRCISSRRAPACVCVSRASALLQPLPVSALQRQALLWHLPRGNRRVSRVFHEGSFAETRPLQWPLLSVFPGSTRGLGRAFSSAHETQILRTDTVGSRCSNLQEGKEWRGEGGSSRRWPAGSRGVWALRAPRRVGGRVRAAAGRAALLLQ